MTINIETLTLDDGNEYVVVSKINYDNKTYLYLSDKNNNGNIKFGFEENEEFVETEDKELITKLLPLFVEGALKEFDLNQILQILSQE